MRLMQVTIIDQFFLIVYHPPRASDQRQSQFAGLSQVTICPNENALTSD